MKTTGLVAYLTAALLLAGCTTLVPEFSPRPSRNAAVLALWDQARQESAGGRTQAAGASLERALRIEPRNPALWQELARIRLAQGQFRQAENLAAKSNALAGDNLRLRTENWRLIGQARLGLGDEAGAQAAFERMGAGQ